MKILKINLAITVLLSVISCKTNTTTTSNDLLAVNSKSKIKTSEIKSAKHFRIW